MKSKVILLILLFVLGACSSKMNDQMKEYRTVYSSGDYTKASELLEKSELKKSPKSKLLFLLEKGTVSLNSENYDVAVASFTEAIDLIDKLYTTKLSAKAASFLVNDATDVFYGASYERSYAHYFLARAHYGRYLKTENKLDLQGARAAILAWDTYFTDVQRSASVKTLYRTDLMMKIFGGQIHEVSKVKNDKQIALQLYKDALGILDLQGGIFSVFNSKHADFIKDVEKALSDDKPPTSKFYVATDAQKELKEFLNFKILSLTKEVRSSDYNNVVKQLKPEPATLKKVEEGKGNVVIVLEEGLIPQKVAKPFNFGLKGAANLVDSPAAKSFIMNVGAEALSLFAMQKLGMTPSSTAGVGGFLFANQMMKFAVAEAAITFELPVVESVPQSKSYGVVVLDDQDKVVKQESFPIVSENGDIAKVVLEEDVVARYVKTGSRIAVKHIVAIVAAMQVYNQLKSQGDFIAKTAAVATYVTASKGIAAFEKADTRYWTTLPKTLRMSELKLPPGNYKLAISPYENNKLNSSIRKIVGNVVVPKSGKIVQTFKIDQLH